MGQSCPVPSRVVKKRLAEGAEWNYNYGPASTSSQPADKTYVTTPSGVQIEYDYDSTDLRGPGLTARIVTKGGAEIEREERDYQFLRLTSLSTGTVARVAHVTLYRDGVQYVTTNTYDSTHQICNSSGGCLLYDFGRESVVTETSEGRARTTTRTFDYGFPSSWVEPSQFQQYQPLILGKLATEATTIGSQSVQNSWTYRPQQQERLHDL